MTDNERRAHEFALMITHAVLQPSFLGSLVEDNGAGGPMIDPYKKYLEAYTHIIDSFNRDFPDGK